MLYKVFLVEDEIVAREGIRDNVDWKSAGFEFCGEAPDGEIALPLIEAAQPDVLITDIKMPFMDGLQLSKIIREHMPWVKIVILSGHDEFEYAQAAVKMGVTEYLLKPASARDLQDVLQRVTASIDLERKERENLKRLRDQVEDNLVLLREKFLLRLVLGGVSSSEAIEQSQRLGLDIVAKYYLVILLKIGLGESVKLFDYPTYERVERLVASLVEAHPDALLTKKDMEELVLIIKGDSPEQLKQDGSFLAELVKRKVEEETKCELALGIGSAQQRLGEIHHSFAEALAIVRGNAGKSLPLGLGNGVHHVGLLKLNQSALENYLKFGGTHDFDGFFDSILQSIGEAALRSYLVKHYIFMDVVLTAAQFVSDLGGNVDEVIPEIHDVERVLVNVKTIEQIREEMRRIFTCALAFRNSQVARDRAKIVHQARAYIENNFTDPELSLNKVASQVNLSASHFSVVFGHEVGETFKDFLTRIRIERAKELLRTTNQKCSEIAYQCGYNDPHYFSYLFKKHIGLSPQRFRAQP